METLAARVHLVVLVIGFFLAPQKGAYVLEVVLEQRAAVACSRCVHDPEHGGRSANRARVVVDGDRVARNDGFIVGVQGGASHPASLGDRF